MKDFQNKILTHWNQVSIDQFIQLKSVEVEDFHSILSYRMDQLFILSDTTLEDEIWDEIDSEKLKDFFKDIEWVDIQPTRNFSKEINIGGIKYIFKEFNTLTLGEFIDLEYLFGINYLLKLPEICAVLYRQNKLNDWGHTLIEPRTYNEKERAELFYDIKITDVYGIIQAYLTYKKQFLDAFENMFEEQEQGEVDLDNEPTTIEEQEAIKKEKLAKKWSWEKLIYQYGNDNNLTFDEVTELSLIFFFNQLSMRKDLSF